jgi:hypothetical protein
VFLLLFLDEIKNEKQKDKQNEWRCVRDGFQSLQDQSLRDQLQGNQSFGLIGTIDRAVIDLKDYSKRLITK